MSWRSFHTSTAVLENIMLRAMLGWIKWRIQVKTMSLQCCHMRYLASVGGGGCIVLSTSLSLFLALKLRHI